MGRPWPAAGEPLFTQRDTEEALALQQVEDEQCDGCGRPYGESMSPLNEAAYEVPRLVCFACRARERASKAAHASETDGLADGMKFIVRLADD